MGASAVHCSLSESLRCTSGGGADRTQAGSGLANNGVAASEGLLPGDSDSQDDPLGSVGGGGRGVRARGGAAAAPPRRALPDAAPCVAKRSEARSAPS